MTTAAVDPGPTVSGIVRFELPKRAKQRESMTAAQIERQAKSLGESGAWDALMCFARPARYVGERRAMGLLLADGSSCITTHAGYRTPAQAAELVTGPLLDASAESGALYLGIAAPPGTPAPLITEPIPWRTEERARLVWEKSADLLRPWASPDAIL